MSKLRKAASFLRWRLVPVRYLTRLRDLRWRRLWRTAPYRSSLCQTLAQQGFHTAPSLDHERLQRAVALYRPRTAAVVPQGKGHPFVNIFEAGDIDPANPVFQLAFSPAVLDVALDYFGGKVILDSIQVLYSWTTGGEVRESQYWHLDYGDRKSFHAITYLNDVTSDDDGPFVFVDKAATSQVGRSLIVRRIPDQQFQQELGARPVQRFLGPAGSMVYVDPSVCYHYGSRCKESRLAVFATFSSWFPFAQPVDLIAKNREKILAAAQLVRPDLNPAILESLLQLD